MSIVGWLFVGLLVAILLYVLVNDQRRENERRRATRAELGKKRRKRP